MYNQMTCQGWENGTSFLGPCSMAWVGLVIVAFLIMVMRRQCDDGFLAGTGFNLIGAIAGGVGANVLLTMFVGSARWSMLAGILGVIIGGFVLGLVWGGGDGDY